jgi:hypothetical protein
VAVPVAAQLPLNIEQLLVKPRTSQLTAAVDFFSSTPIGGVQQRVAGWRSGIRYGVAPGVEVNASVQLADTQRRSLQGVDNAGTQSLTAGANWLLKSETSTPALLLELRAELLRRDEREHRSLGSGQLMLTAYQSIDPVVLSLTGMWDQRRTYRSGDDQIEPGHAWRLDPAVNFAVNPRVTLLGGLSISRTRALRINEQVARPVQEELALRTGIGVSLRQQSQLFLSGTFAPAADASSMTLQWFYEF